MDSEVTVITNPIVNVRLTSTISSFESKEDLIELCHLLQLGVSASCMDLELFSVTDQFLQKLDDNEALLGSFAVDDDCRIHVIDRSGGQLGEFTDVSKVEKFELPDDAYDKRTDSVRSFMKKQRVGRHNEGEVAKKKAEVAAREEEEKAAAEAISVGSRCQVQVNGQPTKVALWAKLVRGSHI
uniref:Tubulin folding cofactor B n=1 Tax=Neogobius melanostomus TaxID=47308 RepID=A0A8C6SAN7_9GOBI